MTTPIAIRTIKNETPDVLRIVTDKPDGYSYKPGQACKVRLDKSGMREDARPFTFVSLPNEPHLEFMIKTYPERDGVTDALRDVGDSDRLIIGDAFGDITYQGPGVFLAGGAGITPFLAIFRDLQAGGSLDGNWLYFANEREADIIACDELKNILGERARFLVTEESTPTFKSHRFDPTIVREIHAQHDADRYYLCGPPDMVNTIRETLRELGVSEQRIVADL